MDEKKNLIEKLATIMPLNEAEAEFYFALDILTGLQKIDLIKGKPIPQMELDKITQAVEERISTGKPLQYILNTAYFYGKKFYVDENVLIPRPETELLVNEVVRIIRKTNAKNILEIGTGSGCLAIMTKLLCPEIEVTTCDISKKALEVAQKNAIMHEVENQINFIHSDVFENVTKKYDIIFSNPPYIPHEQKAILQREVSGFEPHNALFADDNGFYFYNKIIFESQKHLRQNGYLAFEIGFSQNTKLNEILHSLNFVDIKMIYDLNNICRVMSAQSRK